MIYMAQHQQEKVRAELSKPGYWHWGYVTRDRTRSYFPLTFVNFPPATMHAYITPEKWVADLGLEDFSFYPGDN